MTTVHEVEVAATAVTVVRGDLTRQDVDAIVNAANVHLNHGGGVAGAIARAGGSVIQRESDAWVDRHGPLDVGEAAVTSAGDLPASVVVHTAGPVFDPQASSNADRLAAAVRGALLAARDAGARSVAMPAISAGIYGYPPADATAVIAQAVVDTLGELEPGTFDEIRLVGFDGSMAGLFVAGLSAAV